MTMKKGGQKLIAARMRATGESESIARAAIRRFIRQQDRPLSAETVASARVGIVSRVAELRRMHSVVLGLQDELSEKHDAAGVCDAELRLAQLECELSGLRFALDALSAIE